MTTSGSAGYACDYQTFEAVETSTGSRWRLSKRQLTLYAILDAHRGKVFTARQLSKYIVGDRRGVDNIRHVVGNIRRKCGVGIIESCPRGIGYIVRRSPCE